MNDKPTENKELEIRIILDGEPVLAKMITGFEKITLTIQNGKLVHARREEQMKIAPY
ncbi:TPA: hypothetical protein QCV70_002484 [Bacillus cereus]|nr:hypothetical protein [Bacillus cereus]